MSRSITFSKWIDNFAIERELNAERTFVIKSEEFVGFNVISVGVVMDVMKQMTPRDQGNIRNAFADMDDAKVMNYFEFLAGMIAEQLGDDE